MCELPVKMLTPFQIRVKSMLTSRIYFSLNKVFIKNWAWRITLDLQVRYQIMELYSLTILSVNSVYTSVKLLIIQYLRDDNVIVIFHLFSHTPTNNNK